ncbi:uncharacterized protein LOC133288643 [Gastrolobium bilobum]|uniref:uncharacterized protein LOC133288643 n=1 Tax=Gastrolobium bilobum TaxID=150636 RepID=UPI002AB0F7C8|nr:uncharacterized protein LOC133288643 [Gastrolobium bilobum]
MASSQVEIASSSPLGCVLTDHNCRDPCTTHATFHKNILRDHLNTCNDSAAPNNNIQKPMSNADTWVSRVAKNNLGNPSFTRRLHNMIDQQGRDHKDDFSLSALVSPRHSRIIDRWTARKAREMVSTLENHEVEVLNNFPSRSSSFTSRREVSPPLDGTSESEISNLGASSLVQIWEKRLNQSNCNKPNAPASPGRISPNPSCNENAFSVEEQCRVSEEEGDSTYEPSGNEESFSDWESDKTGPSYQSHSPQVHHSSDEKGRVADIIKRLSVTNQMSDENDHEMCSSSVTGSPYRERDRVSTPKQQEHKAFAQVISSPRIRGRQAFNDLIVQFESDRHRELNHLAERGAVSMFSQRGRIQSLLRLRLLQRGVAAFDQSRQKSDQGNTQEEGSPIMQLRERFSTGDEHRTSSLAEVSDPRSPGREIIVSSIKQMGDFPTSIQISKDTRCKTIYGTDIHCKEPIQNPESQTSADNKKEAHPPSSDVTFQGTLFEAQNDDPKETVGACSSMADSNANETAYEVEASEQQYAASSYNETEEEEANDHYYNEASYDWISPISRPRSYWEERRQEWYREMLDFGSDNDEIRKLLERRTVSTFLSSDFRERMDRLMKSHIGTQTHLINGQYDEGDQKERMDQVMEFLQEHLCFGDSPQDGKGSAVEKEEEEEEEEEVKVEEQEKESIISGSDHELGNYFNQSSSPMHSSSSSKWSYRDIDAGDDSDRVASISSSLPSQSQSFYKDSRQYSSSTNHHSIEMEFIYELRGQMVQLFHEMSELRKSIKSCMDMQMQMQLQQSKNQEVHKKSHKRTPKKGNCCICHEKKVNSVLYRCGHMCACLKCANELQCNNGKCPICRAPIIDVVRVYADTESFKHSLAVED